MPFVPTSQVGVADSNQILIKGLTGFRAPFVGVSMERDRHGRKLYCSDQTGAFGSSRVKAGMPAHRLPGKSHSPDVTIAESPDKLTIHQPPECREQLLASSKDYLSSTAPTSSNVAYILHPLVMCRSRERGTRWHTREDRPIMVDGHSIERQKSAESIRRRDVLF